MLCSFVLLADSLLGSSGLALVCFRSAALARRYAEMMCGTRLLDGGGPSLHIAVSQSFQRQEDLDARFVDPEVEDLEARFVNPEVVEG